MKTLAGAALFLATFLVYLISLYPAYKLDDSPMIVTACYNLASQHMPGYPLMTLAGKLATFLPVGNIYFRVNLLAALIAAGSAVLAFRIVERLVTGTSGIVAGLLAGAAMALLPSMSGAAITAKGAIYLLNVFFLLLLAWTMVNFSRKAHQRFLIAGSACLGLAMANHWMSAVLWLPAFVLAGRGWNRRSITFMAVFLFLGVSLYMQIPLSDVRDPAWADTTRLDGFLAMITRSDLGVGGSERTAGRFLLQLGWGGSFPWREGGTVFALVALLGAGVAWMRERRLFWVSCSIAVLTIVAVAAVADPFIQDGNYLAIWQTANFYMPYLVVTVIWFGAGAWWVWRAMAGIYRNAVGVVVVALVLVPLLWGALKADHSRDYLGPDYAENVRASLPSPCTLVATADYHLFPLLAIGPVDAREPPNEVLALNTLKRHWGWKRIAEKHRELVIGREGHDPTPADVERRFESMAKAGNVRFLRSLHMPSLESRMVVDGLVKRIPEKSGAAPGSDEAETAKLFSRMRQRGLRSERPFKDGYVLSVLDLYPVMRAQPGERARLTGDLERAVAVYRRAAEFPGMIGLSKLWRNIGRASGILGDHSAAEKAFRKAVEIDPSDSDSWAYLGTACLSQGRKKEAVKYFKRALRGNAGHRYALEKLSEIAP